MTGPPKIPLLPNTDPELKLMDAPGETFRVPSTVACPPLWAKLLPGPIVRVPPVRDVHLASRSVTLPFGTDRTPPLATLMPPGLVKGQPEHVATVSVPSLQRAVTAPKFVKELEAFKVPLAYQNAVDSSRYVRAGNCAALESQNTNSKNTDLQRSIVIPGRASGNGDHARRVRHSVRSPRWYP